ncbi:hypothetical protein E2C01_086627 [Portunus trituberculatus]|uniref:Uncharacterized protein n=1 Tax=Portunus trituberculatus TaxID=210409 RepID=A0A5B7J1C4_PORTR|nr:hypothetical protein [Portunus trituberculatus]
MQVIIPTVSTPLHATSHQPSSPLTLSHDAAPDLSLLLPFATTADQNHKQTTNANLSTPSHLAPLHATLSTHATPTTATPHPLAQSTPPQPRPSPAPAQPRPAHTAHPVQHTPDHASNLIFPFSA